MAEGATFKYYFTSSMIVCGVILQLLVMYQQLLVYQAAIGEEAFNAFVRADMGGTTLVDKVYHDFFKLRTFQVDWKYLSAIDLRFWFSWAWTLPQFSWEVPDLGLVWLSKLGYSFSFIFLVVEKLLVGIEMLLRRFATERFGRRSSSDEGATERKSRSRVSPSKDAYEIDNSQPAIQDLES